MRCALPCGIDTPPLSLADQACLAIVAEAPTHGWAIVKLLAPDGELGRVWSLSRPLTYRSLDRLADAELIDRADAGRRTELRITRRGRATSAAWMGCPVDHLRDLRTEFLLKLVLLERTGADPTKLVVAQRTVLEPAIAALTEADRDSSPRDVVELWRRESALAARRFLDHLADGIVSPA